MRYTRLVSLGFLAGLAFSAPPLRGQDAPMRVRDSHGWLGFSYGIESVRMKVTPGVRWEAPHERLVVGEVLKGSPADRAGMEPGDTVLKVNGEPATLGRMGDTSRRLHPGDTVRLEVRRAGKDHALTLIAAQRPAYLGAELPRMGETRVFRIDGDSIRHTMRIYLDSARVALDSMHFPGMVLRSDSMIIMQYGRGGRADTLRIPSRDSMRAFYLPRVRELQDSLLMAMPRVHVFERGDFPGPPGFEVELVGRRGIAGAAVQELTPQLAGYFGVREGLLIESVAPGTPSARSGLQAGDVVTAAGGRPVANVADLRRALRGREGDVKLEIVRKGKKQQVTVKWP